MQAAELPMQLSGVCDPIGTRAQNASRECQVPVPVFRFGSGSYVPLVRGLGGVAAGGSAAGVGEGAVLA